MIFALFPIASTGRDTSQCIVLICEIPVPGAKQSKATDDDASLKSELLSFRITSRQVGRVGGEEQVMFWLVINLKDTS